jgi:hypothetical protein
MATSVVNLRTGAEYDVYIGRANPRKRLKASIWQNPFKLDKDGSRDEIMEKYAAYLEGRPDLKDQLPSLKGRVLACWCAPQRCHGDLLARLADES